MGSGVLKRISSYAGEVGARVDVLVEEASAAVQVQEHQRSVVETLRRVRWHQPGEGAPPVGPQVIHLAALLFAPFDGSKPMPVLEST
jgi:hypothetical protein